ncbi:MAG: putative transposase [Cyclobacteriaceae bacterium]|jgi:putative transposase
MSNPSLWSVRNSQMELHQVYFWTSTIKDWNKLFETDEYKSILINCLTHLVEKNKITVYSFVIMPNHIHIVWELDEFNGKEMPHASFNKFTAHEIVKDLKNNQPNSLSHFKVDDKERQYRVWQRDPLAILMDSKKKTEQKIDYIHNNPLNQRWNLVNTPESYYWSSAKY